MRTNKTVLVALSGGVDSSVCAHLLKEAGYTVGGVVLKMSPVHDQTVEDARKAADNLGIPLYVKDMCGEFERNVVDYFVREYQSGRTPNPCIVCNPTVKFRALVETADKYGYEKIATGHYARLVERDGKVLLARGSSKRRDQSYMLYRLTQRELSRLIFPLSELEKDKVREIAARIGLACANKPDSQEICFIPDNRYAEFIEQKTGSVSRPGEFISPEGVVCGMHRGIIHYTVGQRKHLGIALGRPVFVKQIDPVKNRVYLADAGQEYNTGAVITDVTTITGEPLVEQKVKVKIRSVAPLADAVVRPLAGNKAEVLFDTPQRAVAKGQSIVLYTEDEAVIGGGFIDEVAEIG